LEATYNFIEKQRPVSWGEVLLGVVYNAVFWRLPLSTIFNANEK
jgi:hypothetical protein